MRTPPHRLLAALLAALVVAACEHADPLVVDPPGAEPVLLAEVQMAVFDVSCAVDGCHAGPRPPLGLDLSEGQARANLVDVPSQEVPSLRRVRSGLPDSSYLYRKITDAPGIVGQRMPFGRPALPAAEIELVRRWIADGAQ